MNIKSKTSINNVVLLLGLMFSGCGMVSCEERPELSTPSGIPDGSVQVALCFEFSSENLKISRNGKPGTGSPERFDFKSSNAAFEIKPEAVMATRAEAEPDALYNLEVRQYDSAGVYLNGESLPVRTEIGEKISISLTPKSDCQLVIIARGDGNTVPELGTKSLSNVQTNVTANSTVMSTLTDIKKMPYVLHLKHVNVIDAGSGKGTIQSMENGTDDVRLRLKRLAVRLTVNWAYAVADYELKQILLQSVPLKYAVIPSPDATDGTYPSLLEQFTTLQVDAVSNSGSYTCWLPANVRGENAAATTVKLRTKNNSPVGSTFLNFVAVNNTDSKKKLDYRIYLGGDKVSDFNMNSNTDYNYTINFAHAGVPTDDQRVTYIDPIPASEGNDNIVPTANSFMVAPGGSFCFDPFLYRQNGTDITNTVLTGWTGGSRGGIKYVKLLWQTKENGDVGDPVIGVVNSAADHTNVVDIRCTDGSSITTVPATNAGQCRIYCRVASNTQGGNGLIAAYDASDRILWSWHVWVTEYSPSAVGDETVLIPENKRKQKYTYRTDINQLPFMDRYLGAQSGYEDVPATELEKSKANGLQYQWGRKDPFAGSYTNKSISSITISSTEPTDGLANLYGPDGYTFLPRKNVGSKVSVEEASKNPMTTYVVKPAWCSTEAAYWGNGTAGETKTVYDPCPVGWRVPEGKNYYHLFTDTNYAGTSAGATSAAMNTKSISIADGGAVVYYNRVNTTYFRFTGYQEFVDKFNFIGQKVNVWCRNRSNSLSTSLLIRAYQSSAIPLVTNVSYQSWHASDPHPIRCIQEKAD